jgi:hypothetical protein
MSYHHHYYHHYYHRVGWVWQTERRRRTHQCGWVRSVYCHRHGEEEW